MSEVGVFVFAGCSAVGVADRAAELRGRAREDLAAAFKGDSDDLDTGIDLAELERELGDAAGSRTTAELVADRALEAARTLAPSPAAAATATEASSDERAALVHRLRDIFVRALTLLEPAKAADLLTAWTADLTDDEELELMRAVAGHDLSAADGGGGALPAAIEAAERAVRATEEPRGRAFVELAALHAQARHWSEAKAAVERASQDDSVGVQAEYMRDLINDMHRRDDEFGGEPEALVQQLVVEIAESLSGWFAPSTQVGADFFGWMINVFRRTREERVGVAPPRLWVGVRKDLPPGTVRVLVDNRVRLRAMVEDDLLAAAPPEECARVLAGGEGREGTGRGAGGRAGSPPWSDAAATWLPAFAAPVLGAAGVACWDPRGLVLALLDQALEASPRFVSVEEAAELSGEAWEDIAPSEFIARADVVRELLAARVPPGHDLRAVLDAHRTAAPADQPSILAEAIGRLAVAPAPPDRLAEVFAVARLRRPTRSTSADGRPVASITVGVPGRGPHPEAEEAGRRVLDRLCRDLFLPLAELRVERDPTLTDGAISVSVGEVTRLVARPADDLDWWRCHPYAGSAGRTGVAATGLAGRVARAVEAVLWDDPALLFPDAEAAREALAGPIGTTPSQRLAAALLENLGRRVPLGPPDRLKRAYVHVRDRSQSGTVRLPAARTFVSTPRRPVPDNLLFGIRDTIHVDETGRLRQFGVRVQLHHDDDSNLRVSLTSPSGRTIVLHDRGHDLGALRTGVADDRLRALAPLRDEYAQGDWTLHVQDLESRDGGLLEEWSIELTTVSSNPGQPPPTAAPAVALTSHEREALARCESLERDLRSRRIDVECGAALWVALEDNGRRQQEKLRLGALIAREVGLHFGHATEFTPAEDLTDDGFRIVINGLVRAAGELPPGRYGPVAVGSDPGSADLWVGPLSRSTYRRLPDDAPGGFDAPDRLMRHARAAVREAAAEFADADWAAAVLDRLGHTYPITVAAVRSAAGEGLLASVLRELVTQGIAVTDPRLMELVRELVRSPELARECEALASAHPAHIGRTAGAMAEWLRRRLGRTETPLGVPLVELGPEIERAVREAVGGCGDRVPVYALANAAVVLSRLEEARIGLGAAEIAVVTAASIRRHVHRLISAQFPTAQVIAREELDPAVPRELVDVALGEAVGAGGSQGVSD
ncbi:MAG: proprotein convertase P-domain-containing protein [Solirubrobacteraceae bacterium]